MKAYLNELSIVPSAHVIANLQEHLPQSTLPWWQQGRKDTDSEVHTYIYMYVRSGHGLESRPRQLCVFFTVCLRTLPYLLSLVLICIYMYKIDHVGPTYTISHTHDWMYDIMARQISMQWREMLKYIVIPASYKDT